MTKKTDNKEAQGIKAPQMIFLNDLNQNFEHW